MTRVLLVPYPGTWQIEGGHRTQQLQTARALRRLGIDVAVGDPGGAAGSGFDIVHFFGDPRPLLALGRPGGRLVVSPVHFPSWIELGPIPWRGEARHRIRGRAVHLARSVRHPRARARRRAELMARLSAVAEADLVVTNSHAEARLLRNDSPRAMPSIAVAHSGVDEQFFDASAQQGRELAGMDAFVLCVGRVEPIKNQLSLCRAMRGGTALPLLLVGSVLPGNEAYLAACRRELPSLVHIPHLDRTLLRHVYAAAGCHVLASWFETTGLATLEALAAGTPCVVARSPCVEEYFSGHVEMADAGNVAALREAIEAVLIRGPRGDEQDHAGRFTWHRTAEELCRAYGA